ncbi:MAG: PIN domain-containing protein [Pricia sp.]
MQDEWSRNLLVNRPDLKKEQLLSTIEAMDLALPDSNVENYTPLIQGIHLPDPNDRHVVAAAIRSRADIIVTYNLKDFPKSVINEFDIEIQHPDIFLSNVFDFNPEKARAAFKKLVKRLDNPPKSPSEILETLGNSNLKETVKRLKN